MEVDRGRRERQKEGETIKKGKEIRVWMEKDRTKNTNAEKQQIKKERKGGREGGQKRRP